LICRPFLINEVSHLRRRKEVTLEEAPLSFTAGGTELALASGRPGSIGYLIHVAHRMDLNRIGYTVAGDGNVTRSLERNADCS
jgi:hypothetical protein